MIVKTLSEESRWASYRLFDTQYQMEYVLNKSKITGGKNSLYLNFPTGHKRVILDQTELREFWNQLKQLDKNDKILTIFINSSLE